MFSEAQTTAARIVAGLVRDTLLPDLRARAVQPERPPNTMI